MKICYYPAYTRESGSSRLRAFMVAEKLQEWGHDVWFQSAPSSADIIVIQKCINDQLIKIAKEAKEKKIPIVFEFCDPGPFDELIKLADVVTSDSKELLNWARTKGTESFKGRVIETPIDYIEKPLSPKENIKSENLEIGYYAFLVNLIAFKNCRPALERLRKEGYIYSFKYISGQKHPIFDGFDCTWEEWNLHTFSQKLREFDFVVIPQQYSWKGPSKQQDACAHGIPAICEDIPPNRVLYEEAKVTEFLAKTDDEWYETIQKFFNPRIREEFVRKVLPVVWKNCSLDAITRKWLQLFEEISN